MTNSSGEKVRIAVFVSGGGTNFQALIDAQTDGKIPSGEITLVVASKPGVYALDRAAAAGIPSAVVCKKDYACAEDYENELDKLLTENGIGLIVLAGYLVILGSGFTSKWVGRMINVHPSLIPSFCGEGYYGLKVHEAALAKGVKLTGATVHFVNEVPDGGEIILQKAVKVCKGDTPEKLQKRVMQQAEWIILPRAAEIVCASMLKRKSKISKKER